MQELWRVPWPPSFLQVLTLFGIAFLLVAYGVGGQSQDAPASESKRLVLRVSLLFFVTGVVFFVLHLMLAPPAPGPPVVVLPRNQFVEPDGTDTEKLLAVRGRLQLVEDELERLRAREAQDLRRELFVRLEGIDLSLQLFPTPVDLKPDFRTQVAEARTALQKTEGKSSTLRSHLEALRKIQEALTESLPPRTQKPGGR